MFVGRTKEEKRTWFRAERIFNCNGEWYFHTREGIDVGPYDSQLEADIEAAMLRELIRHASVQGEALSVLKDFILESFTMGRPLNVMVSDGGESIIIERPADE
ncbi:MAG: hypothetical protein E2O54_05625 [Gammaproteobacteria bacterium]|nr:MAG: hypothetical protein E2O58_06255 [Gammaproteobacteria bacterium]TDJ41324.1 MAG: hypothetical protein E2O54_05625 [Gammaproteobacteria bacterium]